MEHVGKTMEKPWNMWEKPWKNHGKCGKNHGKNMGNIMELMENHDGHLWKKTDGVKHHRNGETFHA